MGRPVRRHAAASAQGGTRVPLLAGLCASHRNPRSARLAGPVNRSHIEITCTAHPNDCENRTVQQRLCAPCYVGANITRAAPHIRSRQDRAQRGPEHAVRFSAQPPARATSSFLLVRIRNSGARDAIRSERMACTQRYSVQFPNSHTAVLTAHALLTVWHAALAGPRPTHHFRQNRFLRCCSIASSTARNAVQLCGGRRG